MDDQWRLEGQLCLRLGVQVMIRLDDVHAIKLIAQATEMQFVPGLHHCIARYSQSDLLLGGVLFTDYMGGSIQLHVAGFYPNWGSRALLYLSFHYAFEQLKVKKIVALVPEWNTRSYSLCVHLGFEFEYLTDDIFNHADRPNGMLLLSMRQRECRWLGMKPPCIEFAPIERTNVIGMPLLHMPTAGAMH